MSLLRLCAWRTFSLGFIAFLALGSLARSQTFTGGAITIGTTTSGTPYPSNISVSGVSGIITGLTVQINGFNMGRQRDVDMLLVHPDGSHTLIIQSDAGSNTAVTSVNYTISDSGVTMPSTDATPFANGATYKPYDLTAGDAFPAPAPCTGNGSTTTCGDSAPAASATLASVFNGLAANGTWKLYVVNDTNSVAGSITSWSITITTPSCPTITFSTTPASPTCNGGTNGSIVVSGVSGSAAVPFQYSKDGGTNYQASNTFSGLSAGSYGIVVKDNNGCASAASPVMLANPAAVVGAVTGSGAICLGDPKTVTVTVTGGTKPYTVALNNGGGTQTGTAVQTVFNFVVSPASTTTYSVDSANSHDTNNCTLTGSGSATVTVNANPATPTIGANPSQVCANSTGNQASAPAGLSYAWIATGGTITSAANIQTITYTAGAGTFVTLDLTVTNASNCSATNSRNVPINPAPSTPAITAAPTSVDASSPGNQASGPAGATTYAWTIGNGTITSATNIQTITYTAGPGGNVVLNLTVSNGSGCTAFNLVNVATNPKITSVTVVGGVPNIVFNSIAGRNYRVERKDDLVPAGWTIVTNASNINGTGNPITVVDPDAGSSLKRFYHLILLP